MNGCNAKLPWTIPNRLVKRGTGITITYDADGHRVSKTVNGATTHYLVDDRNPTGYAQVLGEWVNTSEHLTRAYVPGLDLISQRLNTGTGTTPVWEVYYYGYDGLGSVRVLFNAAGTTAQEKYVYDAYGQLTWQQSAGAMKPNNYLFAGEQWDNDLGMYYNRARYYRPDAGRFWTMDSYEGSPSDPQSLHKYLYAHANPVSFSDPSGNETILTVGFTAAATTPLRYQNAVNKAFLGVRISRLMAGRGFMKWGWLTGGLAAGVAYLAQDTEFAMDVQLAVRANPTGSEWAYENLMCVEFATDAIEFLQKRGGNPRRIVYQTLPGNSPGLIMAKKDFGFFGGSNVPISENGKHEGALDEGRVYDNNVPFGVSRLAWENGYELFIIGAGEMTIGEAAKRGFGTI